MSWGISKKKEYHDDFSCACNGQILGGCKIQPQKLTIDSPIKM